MSLFHSQLQVGTTLANRYQIISRLGEGGMGAVFLANDLKLVGKQWAIKESLLYSHQSQGFADEAAILVKLDHPFLPKIIDFFPPDSKGYSYLITDFVKGQTLQKIFEARNSISIELVIRYAKQLCQVFDYLHHYKPRPIIYRDLKPSNVMIDEQNNVRLIDFGIARNYTSERNSDTVQLGTVGFAAPEQYDHQQTDPRTDLYTLGALMFYLLNAGQYYSHLPLQTQLMEDKLPEKLVQIITKLLKLYPEDRFQTASQVLTDLEQISIVKPNHDREQMIASHNSTPFPRKLIIVGSLYSGAGSTFVALAMARVLNHYALPHALVENIHNQPALFTLLYGERNVPPNYIYSVDKAYRDTPKKTPIWCNGYTELHPLPPNGFTEIWCKEHSYKLLYSITQPIIVMDVSHSWDDPIVIELCRHADEIVMVSGPSLTRLKLPITDKYIHQFTKFQQEGRSVHCVANRTALFTGQKEWLSTLPINPICSLPEFDYGAVLQAEWGGKLFADQETSLELFIEHLKPLLKKVIPASYFSSKRTVKKQTLLSWFK